MACVPIIVAVDPSIRHPTWPLKLIFWVERAHLYIPSTPFCNIRAWEACADLASLPADTKKKGAWFCFQMLVERIFREYEDSKIFSVDLVLLRYFACLSAVFDLVALLYAIARYYAFVLHHPMFYEVYWCIVSLTLWIHHPRHSVFLFLTLTLPDIHANSRPRDTAAAVCQANHRPVSIVLRTANWGPRSDE